MRSRAAVACVSWRKNVRNHVFQNISPQLPLVGEGGGEYCLKVVRLIGVVGVVGEDFNSGPNQQKTHTWRFFSGMDTFLQPFVFLPEKCIFVKTLSYFLNQQPFKKVYSDLRLLDHLFNQNFKEAVLLLPISCLFFRFVSVAL